MLFTVCQFHTHSDINIWSSCQFFTVRFANGLIEILIMTCTRKALIFLVTEVRSMHQPSFGSYSMTSNVELYRNQRLVSILRQHRPSDAREQSTVPEVNEPGKNRSVTKTTGSDRLMELPLRCWLLLVDDALTATSGLSVSNATRLLLCCKVHPLFGIQYFEDSSTVAYIP